VTQWCRKQTIAVFLTGFTHPGFHVFVRQKLHFIPDTAQPCEIVKDIPEAIQRKNLRRNLLGSSVRGSDKKLFNVADLSGFGGDLVQLQVIPPKFQGYIAWIVENEKDGVAAVRGKLQLRFLVLYQFLFSEFVEVFVQ